MAWNLVLHLTIITDIEEHSMVEIFSLLYGGGSFTSVQHKMTVWVAVGSLDDLSLFIVVIFHIQHLFAHNNFHYV